MTAFVRAGGGGGAHLRAAHAVVRRLSRGDGHLPRASRESGSLAEASHLLWDPRPSSRPRPQPAPSAVGPPSSPSLLCRRPRPPPPPPGPPPPREADPWLRFRASTFSRGLCPWRACVWSGTACGSQGKESLPCDGGWHGARCPSASLQRWSLLRATPHLRRRVLDGQAMSRAPPCGLGSASHS